ncbi:ABC transporter ATP-binding protein [Holdemania filiformis]|uniref:ABC transporter ATP-binding protein n=2 Tax=Holdemania filiformis TaxID=61171 RepID=A0A412FHM2_9FIRM|nr:ABC transporter ATP-binding protein [Holdemania filiformis]RGR67653.1 ABC transporter ATP-binding protein [Holdemania filiformis]
MTMKNNNTSLTLKNSVLTVIAQQRLFLTGLGIVILAGTLAALLPPLVLEQIVNQLTLRQAVGVGPALAYFLFLALAGILESLQTVMITRTGQKITRQVRQDLCAKLDTLPAAYFTREDAGKTVSLFVNDVDALSALFDNGVLNMAADSLKVIGVLVMIFIRSLGLGFLLIVITPLLFAVTRHFQKRMLQAQKTNRAAIAQVNHLVPETLNCLRMIRSLNKQERMEDRYDQHLQTSYQSLEKANFYDSVYSPIIVFSSSAVVAVMMILATLSGGWRSLFGMSVGSAVAVTAYVSKIFTPLENIGMEIENIQSAVAGIQRIEAFFRQPQRNLPEATLTLSALPVGEPALALNHVTFGYEKEETVLRDCSFRVEQGETVTLAGRTGAGKSTIFKLILGLYSPQQGSVTIFGTPADQISDRQKRRLFGYVEQTLRPANGTVGDQISLFDETITADQIAHAVRLVGLDTVIAQLPQGMATPWDPSLFSQGQLQLLAIARAVAADPRILLLDEITANLDSGTEALVMEALRRASANRTVISISHRLYQQNRNGRLISI